MAFTLSTSAIEQFLAALDPLLALGGDTKRLRYNVCLSVAQCATKHSHLMGNFPLRILPFILRKKIDRNQELISLGICCLLEHLLLHREEEVVQCLLDVPENMHTWRGSPVWTQTPIPSGQGGTL